MTTNEVYDGDEFVAVHRSWLNRPKIVRVRATPSILKDEPGQFKYKADLVQGVLLVNWSPLVGRIFDSWDLCVGFLEMQGWTLTAVKDMTKSIPLPVGHDPRQTLERIARDLAVCGTDAEDRRNGRRLLGAIEALWAEDGAEVGEIVKLEPGCSVCGGSSLNHVEGCPVSNADADPPDTYPVSGFRSCCATKQNTPHLSYCPNFSIVENAADNNVSTLREAAEDMRGVAAIDEIRRRHPVDTDAED